MSSIELYTKVIQLSNMIFAIYDFLLLLINLRIQEFGFQMLIVFGNQLKFMKITNKMIRKLN